VHYANTISVEISESKHNKLRINHYRIEKYGRSYPDEYSLYTLESSPFTRFGALLDDRMKNGISQGVHITPDNIIPVSVYGLRSK